MKLIKGNGKDIEIRDVGDPIYKMTANEGAMLPIHGYQIVSDEEAREFIKVNRRFAKCMNLNKS